MPITTSSLDSASATVAPQVGEVLTDVVLGDMGKKVGMASLNLSYALKRNHEPRSWASSSVTSRANKVAG
jgi:hypothetical protein